MASVDVTRIASNIGALNSLNSLQNINNKLAIHQTRLATGKRINSAADDPAGLTIATKMLARSEGLKTALDNIGDAKNMLSVAEAGMSKINDILVQMRNKAEQAASDTLGSTERSAIQTQLSAYAQQIQDLVDQTKWNGVKLLDATTGSKQFQTGVDEGESTTWDISSQLDPETLGLSEEVDNSTASTMSQTGNGFQNVSTALVETSGLLSGMSELTTGGYSVKVLDKATSTTQGKIADSGALLSGITDVTHNAAAAGAAELRSGHYRITVTAVNDTDDVSYRIENLDDASWDTDGIMDVSNADISSTHLVDGSAAAIGVDLTFTGDATDLVQGQTMNFEYVAAGDVKIEMDDASGQAVTMAMNNTNTAQAGFAYADAGADFATGRGISVSIAAFANADSSDKLTFNFQQADEFSVDVSTATKAGQYMTTVNNAMDKVNAEMADLGSLMARLTFKEDQVSAAQINIEASYNRIMNANMAEEQVNASKYQILQQTATAMLAQANAAPQFLLSLFQ